VLRELFVIAALSVAITSCGQPSANPLHCEATLAHGSRIFARDERSLNIKANAKASLAVDRYTVRLTILAQPVNSRGRIRAELSGPDLPLSSSSEGGFDARDPASFRWQATVREGTLSYDCGALGTA
jgi:hypothetical protein